MRYYHRDREWIQQILDSQDKVSITTNVQAPLRSDIRVCDPKREKVLIDTALLVKSLEETKENVRCQSSSFCRVWLTLSGWLQTRVIGKSGRLQFRRSPFGRWLRWGRTRRNSGRVRPFGRQDHHLPLSSPFDRPRRLHQHDPRTSRRDQEGKARKQSTKRAHLNHTHLKVAHSSRFR